MKKTLIRLCCLWLAVVVLGTLGITAVLAASNGAASDSSTIQELRKELDRLEKKGKEYQADLNSVQNEIKTVEQQQREVQSHINNTNEIISVTKKLHTETLAEREKKSAEKAEVELEIADKSELMADTKEKFLEIVRVQYENGESNVLEAVYGANGISDMLSRVQYIGSIMDYNVKLLDKYTAQKEELDQKNEELASVIVELDERDKELSEYSAELDAKNAELVYQKAVQEQLIGSLNEKKEDILSEYNKVLAEEKALDAEIERELAALAADNQTSYVGGTLNWPVSKNIKYISSYYGNRTYYYKGRKVRDFHMGIDIPAAVGTDILAAQSGEVIRADDHSSYGKYMIIDHGGGITTLYAHCTRLLKKKGDTVRMGEHIAEMGSTGQSTGSHLHFEVRVNGKHTNPLDSYKSPTGTAWVIQPK